MPSIFSSFAADHTGDIVAAEAGLAYRPVSELKGLLARSRSIQMFAWLLGALAVVQAVMSVMVYADSVRGGFPTAEVLGAVLLVSASLGAGLRMSLGRYLCVGISAVLIAQVAWYISSPSHWIWNSTSAFMLARFLLGWVGLVSFVGTYELFGADRMGHATLKDAVETAIDVEYQATGVLQMQTEAPRVEPTDERSSKVA